MLWWIAQIEMKKKETNDVRNNMIKLVSAMKQIQTYKWYGGCRQRRC